MASTSWPDPAASRVVTDGQYEKLIYSHAGDGVSGAPTDSSVAYGDSSGKLVKIRPYKRALVHGYMWDSGAATFNKTISDNTSGQPRLDLLVLRYDRSTFKVTEVVKAGTPATNPTLPTVQQDPDLELAGSGLWEIPLAKIAVANGFTTINASDVTRMEYYLSPSRLLCTSATRPGHRVGLEIYETDTGNAYTSTGSAWGSQTEDTGWIDCGAASGYHTNPAKIRRVNKVAYMSAAWQRSGATVAARTIHVVGTVPAGMIPAIPVKIGAYLDGANLIVGHVDPNGGVYMDAFWVPIATGGIVTVFAAAWPVG